MIRDHISRVEIFTSELATILLREMFLRFMKKSLSERIFHCKVTAPDR